MSLRLLLLILATLNFAACTKKSAAPADNTLNLVIDSDIKTLDPISSTDTFSTEVIQNIYESLLTYHYSKRPLQLIPSLAKEMPQISKDGLTITVTIKKGVYFQDSQAFPKGKGRELVASDFIYSWKRLADPKLNAQGFWVFNRKVKGLNEWRESFKKGTADYNSNIEGLQAPEKYKLLITLTKPNSQFLHFLAMANTAAVAKEVTKEFEDNFASNPIGTGPYVLKKWVRNSEILLEANPNYRKELFPNDSGSSDVGKPLPLTNKLSLKIIPEFQPRWLNFLKGKIAYSRIPKDSYSNAVENDTLTKAMADKGIKLQIIPRPDVTFIGFNLIAPHLAKNKLVRQAMSLAFDRKTYVKLLFNGRAEVAHSPIPPGLDGHRANWKSKHSFNLEKAKELLKKAGFPKGKDFPVLSYAIPGSNPTARQFAEYTKQQFSKIGIQIKVNSSTWAQFDQKLKGNKTELFSMSWSADYPDSENFLQLFYSKNRSPGPNNFNFSNKKYDELYEKIISTPLSKARTNLIYKAVSVIDDEVPGIFLVHRKAYRPSHGWLRNYHYHPAVFNFYKYLGLDKKLKQELLKKL